MIQCSHGVVAVATKQGGNYFTLSSKSIASIHYPFIMPEEISSPNESGDDEGKQRKRKERLEQNRISARESRKRKKTMIEELQRTVITLSRENKELNERNEALRRQLMELGAKVSVCGLWERSWFSWDVI